MKKTILGLIIPFLLLSTVCQRPAEQQRRIRLSDEMTATRSDDQRSTTIHLEPTSRRAVAVTFFENETGDENFEWLRRGLTEMFVRSLSQSRYLSVLSTDRVYEIFERLDRESGPSQMDMDMAAVVAREANVEAVLTGHISKNGDVIRIGVKVHEQQGTVLREESIEGTGLENLLAMVDELSLRIKGDLQLPAAEEESLRQLTDLTTNSLEAWQLYTQAMDYIQQFIPQASIELLEHAVTLDPTFVDANLQLSSVYRNINESQKAYTVLQHLQTLRHKATPKERYQIDILDSGFKNDAIAYLEAMDSWLAEYPNDRDAHFRLGNQYRGWNNHEAAIQSIQRVINLDPKYGLAYNLMGYEYAALGDFKKAVNYLKHYIELAPGEANPYDSMAEINFMFGNYREAIKYYKRAFRTNEQFTTAIRQLAHVYMSKGKFRKSLKLYKEYEQKVDDDAGRSITQYQLGTTHLIMGRTDKAIALFERSLETNSTTGNAYNVIDILHRLYSAREGEEKSKDLLERMYSHYQSLLASEATQTMAFQALLMLSLFWDTQIETTTQILSQILEARGKSMDVISKNNMQFYMTLLYGRTGREEEIDVLWPEQAYFPEELWTLFSMINNQNYSENWKVFMLLNDLFSRSVEQGIDFYAQLIDYTTKHEVQSLEMMFRLLSTHLYYQVNMEQEARDQLRFVGMPEERQWMILGPYKNKDGFRKQLHPEKRIQLDRTYREVSGPMRWERASDGIIEGFINFSDLYDRLPWHLAYGLIYIDSPQKQTVHFRFGTDDGCKLWLNDKTVWAMDKGGPAIFDDNKVKVKLKQGLNKVLIKVCNRPGDWGFFFRVTDAEGQGISDIRFVSADTVQKGSDGTESEE